MTKDEALDLALEALEGIHPGNMTPMAEEYWNKALTAIKQARSAPVQPIGYVKLIDTSFGKKLKPVLTVAVPVGAELYTTLPVSQPAPVQEPVARQYQGRDGVWKDFISEKHYKDTLEDGSWPIRNLYTTPPAAQRQWVGLTDEEFEDIELGCRSTSSGKIEAMQKVEAKLKEKNT
jgi:hypothetical protein